MTDNITTPDGGLMAIPDAIDVPGLMVAIFNRTGLLWSAVRGVRDAESGAPLDLSTWFPLGAITQTLTAMAIVGLRDAGALSLDDPISRHVPEALGFRYPTKDSAPITLRHLLTHTAGLSPGARELRKLFGDDPSEPDLLAHICSLEMAFVPGTAGRHSDLAFTLLGIVIERVSGEEVSDFVARRLLGPMGLQAISFRPAGPLAVPHRKADNGAFRPRTRPRVPEPAYRAALGLYGTVAELCAYGSAHLSAWPPRDESDPAKPLRRATLRETHRPAGFHRVGRNSQGLGWLIERDSAVGDIVFRDGASLSGYSSFIGFEPDVGIGAAALANADIDLKKPLFDLMGRYKVAHGLLEDWRR